MTAPPAGPLARVRALAPVAALDELWQQRPDETADEYAQFMGWLDAGATRGTPGDVALATRHEWAERALAYERATTTLAPVAGTTPEATIVSNLTRMVQLETDKLLKQSASTTQPVVGVKDLVAVMGLVQELHDKGRAASSAAAGAEAAASALEGLTIEEKRAILKFQLLQRKSVIK